MTDRPPVPPREPDHEEDAPSGDPDYVPHEREEFLEEIDEEREHRTDRDKQQDVEGGSDV